METDFCFSLELAQVSLVSKLIHNYINNKIIIIHMFAAILLVVYKLNVWKAIFNVPLPMF